MINARPHSASANAGTCSAASTDLVRCIRLLTVYLNCASYDGRSGIESNWVKFFWFSGLFCHSVSSKDYFVLACYILYTYVVSSWYNNQLCEDQFRVFQRLKLFTSALQRFSNLWIEGILVNLYGWAIYALTSVFKFSVLLFIHFRWYLQGEFV